MQIAPIWKGRGQKTVIIPELDDFLTLAGLSAVLHGYIGWRLLPGLSAFPGAPLWLGGVLLFSALVTPLGLLAHQPRHRLLWGPPKRFGAPSRLELEILPISGEDPDPNHGGGHLRNSLPQIRFRTD